MVRLVRELRTLEARGEVRGGRFVAGFDGEQYALPDAVTLLRTVRKRGRVVASVPVSMPPSDPLPYLAADRADDRADDRGVLAPEPQAHTA